MDDLFFIPVLCALSFSLGAIVMNKIVFTLKVIKMLWMRLAV